jgi:hypothetical protein
MSGLYLPDQNVMLLHGVKADPRPKPGTNPGLAYERLQCTVLSNHLLSVDPAIKSAALVSLQRLVTDEKTAFKVHEAGLLDQLAELVVTAAPEYRETDIPRMALDCIGTTIASPALRLKTFERPPVIAALRACISSESEGMRRIVYKALRYLAETPLGCQALLKEGFAKDIVSRVGPELQAAVSGESASATQAFSMLLLILHVCRDLASNTSSSAVDTMLEEGQAVPVLTEVIIASGRFVENHSASPDYDEYQMNQAEATRLAADILMSLAMPSAGKRACLRNEGTVEALLNVCKAGADAVDAAGSSAGCLMNVSVDDEAKAILTDMGTVKVLCQLLAVSARAGCATGALYSCKCLNILSSHPVARAQINAEADALSIMRQLAAAANADDGTAMPGIGSIAGAVGKAAELCLGGLKLPYEN